MSASDVSGRAYPRPDRDVDHISVPIETLRSIHEVLYRARWDAGYGLRLPGVIFHEDVRLVEEQIRDLIEHG